MKKTRIITLILALILVTLAFYGCARSNVAEIVKMPDRCVYYVGETLDVTGGQIKTILDGEEKLIDMTADMAAFFTDEGTGYAGTTFADQPFKTDGRKTVYLKNGEGYITFTVYVDGNIENYKAYCYTVLDGLEKHEACDGAALSVITAAKEKINLAKDIDDVTEALGEAKSFAEQYYAIRLGETARDDAADVVMKKLDAFDFSPFARDHQIDIKAKIEKLKLDLESADTREKVEKRYSEFEAEIATLSGDKANEFVLSLEKRFEEEYAKKRGYYTQSSYTALENALIEHERLARQKTAESDMTAVANTLFGSVLPAIPDVVTTLFGQCEQLLDGLKYPEDKQKLDAINAEIVLFIEELEGVKLSDTTGDSAVDARDILASAEYKSYEVCKILSANEKGDVLSAAKSLMDRYDVLSQASKESTVVIKVISSIGSVKLDSGSKITSARKTYDDWCKKFELDEDDENRDMITNYATLAEAEETFKDMPARAKSDAANVRTLIKSMSGSPIIYSDTAVGTGEKLSKAEKAYSDWIKTYGDFAVSYINDGTDYIGQLESYRLQYNRIVSMADDVLAAIKDIYEQLGKMEYDTLSSDYKAIEVKYEALNELYENFKNSNGEVVDVVDEFDNVLERMARDRVGVVIERNQALFETYVDAYIELMSDGSAELYDYRWKLRSYLTTAKNELSAAYNPDMTFEMNVERIDKKYDECSDKVIEIYDEYQYAYAKYRAINTITTIGKEYKSSAKRDELVYKAKNDIDKVEYDSTYRTEINRILNTFTSEIELFCDK